MGVTRVANVTGLDYIGVPVVMVCRPNSRSLATTQGKGMTIKAAKVSGIMEAVEAFHAEGITKPLKLASFAELQNDHRITDVKRLPKVKDCRFAHSMRTLWIEGFDLLQQGSVWIPFELVHCDYTRPLPEGSGCFLPTTNGLAAGNEYLEAISHGICEVIERDAISMASVEDPPPDFTSFPQLDLENR